MLGKKESRKTQQVVKKEDDVHIADMFKNGDTNDNGQDNEQDEEGWTKVQSKSKGSIEHFFVIFCHNLNHYHLPFMHLVTNTCLEDVAHGA